jgi:peptide/nickel transport system permease protein
MELTTKTKQTNQSFSMKKSASPWAIARRKFLKNKLAMAGLIFIVIVTILSILAPYITEGDVTRVNYKEFGKPPSAEHWLGTDNNGRDVLQRLLYGGRISLTVGFSCVALIITIGTIIGSIAGYFGGKIDSILMRFTDFILNFPFLLFVIVVNAIFIGKLSGVSTLILVISFLGWGGTARIVRSRILAEKENEYVLAAVSIGCKPYKVIIKHLIPNVISTVIVQASLLLASMIVAETAISFLGFGVPQNVPSWGNMLSDSRNSDVLLGKPWIWVPPATIITLTILSINFVGEGLKDAFNPKSAR